MTQKPRRRSLVYKEKVHVAVLSTFSEDAGSLAKALEANNRIEVKVRVKSFERERFLVSVVEADSILTLLNAIDELIFCQQVVERSIR